MSVMEEFLDKKYVLVSSENFEDYLVHIGVGYLSRKAALALKPTQCLTLNEDGTYTFEFSSALVSYKTTFTPGVEFVEEKPDGIKVEALITIEDNKMIHTQREENGRTSIHSREFYKDRMIVIRFKRFDDFLNLDEVTGGHTPTTVIPVSQDTAVTRETPRYDLRRVPGNSSTVSEPERN